MIPIRYLTLKNVIALAARYGLGPVADIGLLASAVARPRTTYGGEDAYPTLATKAAALLHSVTRNHALVDGNKRLGWVLCAVFLGANLHWTRLDDDGVYDLVIDVAEGRLDVEGIAQRLQVVAVADLHGATADAVRALGTGPDVLPVD